MREIKVGLFTRQERVSSGLYHAQYSPMHPNTVHLLPQTN